MNSEVHASLVGEDLKDTKKKLRELKKEAEKIRKKKVEAMRKRKKPEQIFVKKEAPSTSKYTIAQSTKSGA